MRQLLAALALLLALPLHPQAAADQGSLPSRLRAAVSGAELLFSWEAPADPQGGWELLRSAEPFSASSFAGAELLQKLPASARSLSLRPSDQKAWYYALLPLDAAGRAPAEFQPGRTVTASPIAVPPEALAAAPAGSAPAAGGATTPTPGPTSGAAAPPQAAAGQAAGPTPPPASPSSLPPPPDKAGVYQLRASLSANSLTLSFVLGRSTGTILVYRSTLPFKDASSLLSASLIASLPETTRSFVDFPVPGMGYYYALVSESGLRAGTLRFDGVGAATSIGPLALAAEATDRPLPETGELARSYPLPSWLFAKPGDPGLGAIAQPVSAQTEKAIASILAPFPAKSPNPPTFALLQEDRGRPRGGEEYALSLIVQGPIKTGDWQAAAVQLRDYLSLNRSPALASRANFYLGQSYALTGRYRDSFFEFLLARDFHPAETRPWLLWLVAMDRG